MACNQQNKNRRHADKFYTEKSDWDVIRIPLVKPYEALNLSSDQDWSVQLADMADPSGGPISVPGTKHINVIDSVILIHSRKTILDGEWVNEAWFVFIPKNQIFRGFKTHREYLNYTSSIKIKDPKLYDANEIMQYFNKKDTVDWQEINRLY